MFIELFLLEHLRCSFVTDDRQRVFCRERRPWQSCTAGSQQAAAALRTRSRRSPSARVLFAGGSLGACRTSVSRTAIWAAHKVYWAGDVTGVGVSSLFRSPATLDRNNSVTVTPVHFLFCYNKPEVESFRSRVRLSKSSKNWSRNENFCVIVSEVGWLSLKWYGGENVYNRDRQRPDSLANTDRRRSPNRKKAK